MRNGPFQIFEVAVWSGSPIFWHMRLLSMPSSKYPGIPCAAGLLGSAFFGNVQRCVGILHQPELPVCFRITLAPSKAGICPANPHSLFGFPNFDTEGTGTNASALEGSDRVMVFLVGLAVVGQVFYRFWNLMSETMVFQVQPSSYPQETFQLEHASACSPRLELGGQFWLFGSGMEGIKNIQNLLDSIIFFWYFRGWTSIRHPQLAAILMFTRFREPPTKPLGQEMPVQQASTLMRCSDADGETPV